MSIAFTRVKGLTYYDSRKACLGVTLFAPMDGAGVWLINMKGEVVKHWEMGYKPGCYGELLPNRHLLYEGRLEDGPLTDLEGAGGILLELDWDDKIVWKYEDPYLHHAFYRMKNGNTLVLKWVKVPDEIAARVEGGIPGSEREGVMWGDVIQEITPEGIVAWEWIAHDHLDPSANSICILCPRSTWLHTNSIVELPDGNILVSFMGTHTIAIIDRKSGNVTWQWGSEELGHQHCLSILDNGSILVFDNGLHSIGHGGYSRALEVSPKTNKMVWTYGESMFDAFKALYSPTMSSCQRLPNGNTLICEAMSGRLFEVTYEGEIVWEYISPFPSHETPPNKPDYCPVYAAFRYEMGYSGLKRPTPVPEGRQATPGTPTPTVTGGEVVRSRLQSLGY